PRRQMLGRVERLALGCWRRRRDNDGPNYFSSSASRCMTSPADKLRADAERIWRAGVAAVLPARLIPQNVRVGGGYLGGGDELIDLRSIGKIAIVGAGKAAGAMAVALESALGSRVLEEKQVEGWVNVPANCVVPTQRVRLHAARAPGVNEPSAEGVEGTQQ